MATSKRVHSEVPDASPIVKKPKRNNGELVNRHLEAVLNESYSYEPGENSLTSSPSEDRRRKRVSLSNKALREQHGRKSLATFIGKDATITDKPDHDTGEEIRPVNPVEYKNNLSSLHEIISKSFDPKRAFSYNFINIMNTFINNDKGHVDFKLIALSLEAGTRVYTSKVDVVYRSTQKVSSSLSMATDEKNHYDDDDEALFDDDNMNKFEKKRKKKKKNAPTLVINTDTINGKFETNIEIDPLFHHLSAAFDVGNVNSLLMANLSTDPNEVMLLDSNASLDFSGVPNLKHAPMNYSLVSGEIKSSFNGEKHVCQATRFRDFEFTRRDIKFEVESRKEEPKNLNYDFDYNAEVEDINEFANDFDLADHLNHSISDTEENINEATDKGKNKENENGNENGNENENENENENDNPDFEDDKLMQIIPSNANQFFNKNFLMRVFKKMSRFNKSKIILTTENTKKPKPRKERAAHKENKYSLVDEGFEANESQKFSAATLEKWISTSTNFQLRADYGFGHSHLKECFGKRNTFFHELKSANSKKPTEKVDPPHEIAQNSFDDDGVQHEDDISVNPEEPLELNIHTQQKLYDEPLYIDALDIDYAKVAKKIDIKRVKKGMWDVIVKEATDTQSMFGNTPLDTASSSTTQKPFTFYNLRQTLPNYLNSNLNENLSVPISFVALLHLCNEKTLSLTTQDNHSDFIIQAPV